MTAIERLCQLLDERGADYMTSVGTTTGSMEPYQRVTVYENGILKAIIESCGGNDEAVYLQARITPEHAVEATLGRGTCRDLAETPDYRDKTEFRCSECGYEYSSVGGFGCDYGDEPDFTYCPNCGRRVEL